MTFLARYMLLPARELLIGLHLFLAALLFLPTYLSRLAAIFVTIHKSDLLVLESWTVQDGINDISPSDRFAAYTNRDSSKSTRVPLRVESGSL